MLLSKIIRKQFDAVLGRYDGSPAVYEFSPSDFPELCTEDYEIQGDYGNLRGFFYWYGQMNPQKLVIFDHGIGSGHRAYLKEIEYLAHSGYTVYSYDHTGCAASDGSGILGFSQGVRDLDCVVTAILRDPRFAKSGIRLVGHSWGGYASMNVTQNHPEITHVVSLAGFLSARALIEQYLPQFVRHYSSEVMEAERRLNPRYADLDARESLKESSAKLFYLQSRDDRKVKYELGMKPLSEALKGRTGTEFLSLDRRNHDPQRTEQAAKAHAEMEYQLKLLRKKNRLKTVSQQKAFRESWDWELINQQDPKIWEKILQFLQS